LPLSSSTAESESGDVWLPLSSSGTNRRVRKVLQAAEEAGKAEVLEVPAGEVIFRQVMASDGI
jgi:hypothetical protein